MVYMDADTIESHGREKMDDINGVFQKSSLVR